MVPFKKLQKAIAAFEQAVAPANVLVCMTLSKLEMTVFADSGKTVYISENGSRTFTEKTSGHQITV